MPEKPGLKITLNAPALDELAKATGGYTDAESVELSARLLLTEMAEFCCQPVRS